MDTSSPEPVQEQHLTVDLLVPPERQELGGGRFVEEVEETARIASAEFARDFSPAMTFAWGSAEASGC